MPQLFPMNWNILMIMFITIIIIMTTLIYFNYKPYLSFKKTNKNIFSKNWKW
nr:ATP synthase F0 subunit 8 [Reticulinasus faini]